MTDKSVEDKKATNMSTFWILAGCVLALWFAFSALNVTLFDHWEVRGQVGDSFGAINSLFSGLAFAGVIFTIYLQRQELALQRNELSLTREQLARAADAQEQSEQALAQQVQALHEAAYLTALNSLIDHYDIKIRRAGPANKKLEAENNQMTYVDQLEDALRAIEPRLLMSRSPLEDEHRSS